MKNILATMTAVSLACLSPVVAATPAEAEQAMEKATKYMTSIATEGGYLYKYSPDLQTRFGESAASARQIWVQPPGSSSMGMAFLKAYEATGNSLYLAAASGVAGALGKIQLPSGGWHYSGDFDRPIKDGQQTYQGDLAKQAERHFSPHYLMATTYDDDNTQSAIRFLMSYIEAAKKAGDPGVAAAQKSLDQALEGMLRAQYPNGAWPQRFKGERRDAADYPVLAANYPADYPKEWPDINYETFYTLNDNCQRDCIFLMYEAYERYGKAEYLEAARKGADFILLAQMPEPQPGWAQQYDFKMQPAWARIMEPPGISSAETRGALQALFEIYLHTGEEKYLEPIKKGLAWLDRSTIAPNTWSRLYELRTNKPIYGGEGGIYYDVKQARKGYTWQSKFKIPDFKEEFARATSMGRDAYVAELKRIEKEKLAREQAPAKVQEAISSLDDQGRWLTTESYRKFDPPKELISTEVFIRNLNALSNFVATSKNPASNQ